jgi:putative two-component system response regulator
MNSVANADSIQELNSTSKITNQELLKSKVLIVDDEPKNVKLIHQLLQSLGYENIRFTYDPIKACDMYSSFWPDLVVLDLMMPIMDGFQVMEEMGKVEQRGYIPILVLTAQTDRKTRLKALNSGAKDFLLKPLDLVETTQRIQNILEVRLLQNKLRDHNFQLEERILERTKELQSTRLSVIQRLGHAAEYRDNDTGNHIKRMSQYAMLLAKQLDLDGSHCNQIFDAIPMHDVGKIGIPDGILLKPGKHNSEEWEVMKTHSVIGYEILSNDPSALISLAAKIALEHHEKWDGSGYPNGLKGEEISIEARICTICDVFDALTSERPYKKAWSVEEAVRYIDDQNGKIFEPMMVEKFKEVLSEFTDIKDQFEDNDINWPGINKLH